MWTKFRGDERGTVAIIFALTSFIVLGMVGMAIDFGRAMTLKTELQASVDASALAGARVYRETNNNLALAEEKTREFFEANTKGMEFAPIITIAIDTDLARVHVVGKVEMPCYFMQLFRFDKLTIESEATAQMVSRKLELSLMLDVTGSMDERERGAISTKLAALKLAVADMLEIFNPHLEAGFARIAVAPFSEGVYAGNKAATLRGNPPTKKTVRSEDYRLTQCVSERGNGDRYADTFGNLGAVYNTSGQCATASRPLALTKERSTIASYVNALDAKGGTAGHIGTAWAWYLLAPNWAGFFGHDVAPYGDKKHQKAAVLMTDGEYNLQYCDGISDAARGVCTGIKSGTQARALCAAMKAKGIDIYTVGFALDSADARAVLKDCASSVEKFFDARDAETLRASFAAIGKALAANLHLAE